MRVSAKSGRWYAFAAALLIGVVGQYGCGAGGTGGDPTDARPFGPTPDDRSAPTAPAGLTGSAPTPSQITLNWGASTDNVAVTGYRVYRNGTLLATLGNVTSYQNTGLSASTTYSYTVQAFDGAGNSSAQSAATIVATPAAPDTVAPSAPTGLVATAVSGSRINLSWSASTDNVGVTGYRVSRNGTLLPALGNVTVYQDNSLSVGTTYVYTVQARDAAGNLSGLSPQASATTTPDTTPPTMPTNLAGTAVLPTQINLSWSASTDNDVVANYRLYRNGVLTATPTSTAYPDTGLTATTTYSYTVEAIDPSGNVSGMSAPVTVTTPSTPDTTAPTTPTGLTATAISDSRIDLGWVAATDNVAVTGYRIFRNSTLIATVGNVTTYANTGLAASTTFSYTVRALDAAGNVSGASTAASATTPATPDTIAPTTPANLAATTISSSRIGLTWSASTDNVGVTGYRVYQNGTFLFTTLGNVTTYQSTGLTPATPYTYNVDAIDAAGNASGTSAAANATTLLPTTATLAWDAVTDPRLSGYRIYFGTAPGTYSQSAGNGLNVFNVTTFTITGLTSGTRYYFAVTAYDGSNNESGLSNEVFKDIP